MASQQKPRGFTHEHKEVGCRKASGPCSAHHPGPLPRLLEKPVAPSPSLYRDTFGVFLSHGGAHESKSLPTGLCLGLSESHLLRSLFRPWGRGWQSGARRWRTSVTDWRTGLLWGVQT